MATTNIGGGQARDGGGILPEEGRALNEISAGEVDDTTGETIIYVVYSTEDFIVTIDKKLSLNWETAEGFDGFASDFGELVSSVELSDALVDRIFADSDTRFAYKKMLGSVLGRLLDDGESSSARKQLAIVDERINAHGRERMRMSYIQFSLIGLGGIAIAFLAMKIFKLENSLTPDNLALVSCVLLGGIGAFITTFARFQRYEGNLVAGVGIHRLDGFLRIFYGLIAGLIVFYAVKANVLLGFGNDSKNSQPWLFYFLAMVAGASEVLIPNLIRQTEGELGIKKLEEKEKQMGEQGKPVEQAKPVEEAKPVADQAKPVEQAKPVVETTGDGKELKDQKEQVAVKEAPARKPVEELGEVEARVQVPPEDPLKN